MTRLLILLMALSVNFAIAKDYKTGLTIPQNWKKTAKFSSMLGVKVPDKFDWRQELATRPEVKNQGGCGSCWAFATSTVMEWQLAKAKKLTAPLSPQELVSCDQSSYGCSGGFFTAFNYTKNPGLTFESDFPYEGENTACEVSELPHDNKIFSWGYVGDGSRTPSVEEIKAQIYSNGPVSATVCANSSFMNYKAGTLYTGGGFFANCQNHMITLVGYDSNEGSWILQNSWGEEWGDAGYMRIKWGSNAVGQMAAFAVYK